MSDHPEIIMVLLADDHPLTREGIRSALSKYPDIRIISEVESGYEVEKMVGELHPQVLLLDLVMPGPTPAQLEKRIREKYPNVITLVLTAHNRDVYLASMMDAGAAGFLLKTGRTEQLVESIRNAARGEILYDSEQLKRVREWREGAGRRWDNLTEREREILQMLSEGLDNIAVAKKLVISPKTVAFHVTNLLEKLGARSRHEAVAWLHKNLPDNLD